MKTVTWFLTILNFTSKKREKSNPFLVCCVHNITCSTLPAGADLWWPQLDVVELPEPAEQLSGSADLSGSYSSLVEVQQLKCKSNC